MKTIYFFSLCLFLFACNSNPEIVETPKKIHVINQSTTKNGITTAKFTVWGNCGMCKETIEKSLKIPGVKKADWHIERKILTVSLDTALVDLQTVQQAIASVGYDNVKYNGDSKAYSKLHACCQYERK
jgi:mercuric ion binding protein